MKLRIALTSVVLLALAGCAGSSPEDAAAPPAAAETGPIALIGLWTVEGASEEPGTVLRIAPQKQLSLWRACGMSGGSWAATDTLFVGSLNGGSQGCSPTDPDWLKRAVGFGSAGDEVTLTGQDGKTVARLVPGGKPKVPEGVDASEAAPPVITDEDRAALEAPVAQLPAGLTAGSLVGRWVPVSGGATAFVEFKDDGSWTGSDGCNGNGGRWAAGPNGSFLATTGPSTLIACDGASVPGWLSTATLAGVSDGQLVLVDVAGKEVGRLKKG